VCKFEDEFVFVKKEKTNIEDELFILRKKKGLCEEEKIKTIIDSNRWGVLDFPKP
jgi:hypothetical protein